MRETVFPPAYTRFIKKGDTSNEWTTVWVAWIRFLEIAPLAEATVPKTEYTFWHSQVVGVKVIFNNIPFIGFKVSFHGVYLNGDYGRKDKQING